MERHLAHWLENVPDRAGTYLVARPVAAIASAFDDRAVVAAAAKEGIALAPLSACYAGRGRRQGLILGYAGTPEDRIDSGCATVARVLRRVLPALPLTGKRNAGGERSKSSTRPKLKKGVA
jgi:GntR family transcriptional regulator/MocR family aminotransferase